MSDLTGRSISGKIRMHDGSVFLSEQTDHRPCKCCASECEAELTVEVTFCNFTATLTVPIPGTGNFNQDLDLDGPGTSYIELSVEIVCTACGWELIIGICAFCEETNVFASDGFTAFIPFAMTQEPGGGYCPEAGAIDLTCFGDQFGIPCVTNTTASIA